MIARVQGTCCLLQRTYPYVGNLWQRSSKTVVTLQLCKLLNYCDCLCNASSPASPCCLFYLPFIESPLSAVNKALHCDLFTVSTVIINVAKHVVTPGLPLLRRQWKSNFVKFDQADNYDYCGKIFQALCVPLMTLLLYIKWTPENVWKLNPLK